MLTALVIVALGVGPADAGHDTMGPAHAGHDTMGPANAGHYVQAQVAGELRGGWSATLGSRVFRGTWSGQALPDQTDTAQGAWTLMDARNQIILRGTWSATKVAGRWQGQWSARVAGGRRGSEDIRSGTWSRPIKDGADSTLAEMLEHTLDQEITGAWRSGPNAGGWLLKGFSK